MNCLTGIINVVEESEKFTKFAVKRNFDFLLPCRIIFSYYVFIDEIQLCLSVKNPDIDESIVTDKNDPSLNITFYDVLNDLKDYENLDVYVTCSNSRMLSSDIVTNFRDRGSEIKVYPLMAYKYVKRPLC